MSQLRFLELANILAKCKPHPNGECLEWTGAYFRKNMHKYKNDHLWAYPQIYYKKKSWRGNRLVMFLRHGKIPKGKLVLHKCDNNKCLSPIHLYFGTHAENSRDAVQRKRHGNSSKTTCLKGHALTEENIYITRRNNSFYRRCKKCHKIHMKEFRDSRRFK